jgi:isopenicillin-N N-acyltransferase like protein
MIRVLNLYGDPRSIGFQHGQQVADLRPQICSAIEHRLAELNQPDFDFSKIMAGMTAAFELHAQSTLEMLQGVAEALDLEWEKYYIYTFASFLDSQIKNYQEGDGCTTWAATGKYTRDQAPVLAKNRDYKLDHIPLQCLARVRPTHGYPYICLTSAGSPGVFNSGMNSKGLAVADTFVASKDLGFGIPRYSLMMNILEKFDTVQDAIQYFHTVPHTGDGTVILVDASGDMAVFEIAHSVQAVRIPEDGFIASTNHFTFPVMRKLWVDREPPHLKGNSKERYRRVRRAIKASSGKIDIPWSQALMTQHQGPLGAICRHAELSDISSTIGSIIYLPKLARLWVANGVPCRTQYECFSVMDQNPIKTEVDRLARLPVDLFPGTPLPTSGG